MVVELENDDQVTQVVNQFMEKKRKTTGLEEVSREALKFKKQKQCKDGMSKKIEEKKVPQVAPTGYVHVRARRGQATDSHSLAERVRREKISERMGLLQSLVPGCDKIIGKAFILDEIINYIQSLQNQVEFLVAKLASVYPMLNDTRTLASEDYGDMILDVDNQSQMLVNDYGFENLSS